FSHLRYPLHAPAARARVRTAQSFRATDNSLRAMAQLRITCENQDVSRTSLFRRSRRERKTPREELPTAILSSLSSDEAKNGRDAVLVREKDGCPCRSAYHNASSEKGSLRTSSSAIDTGARRNREVSRI